MNTLAALIPDEAWEDLSLTDQEVRLSSVLFGNVTVYTMVECWAEGDRDHHEHVLTCWAGNTHLASEEIGEFDI